MLCLSIYYLGFGSISNECGGITLPCVVLRNGDVFQLTLTVVRQPYLGWRSQEKLKSNSNCSLVTTPAQRLAVSEIK